jgi:hypothetical protein
MEIVDDVENIVDNVDSVTKLHDGEKFIQPILT